MPMTAEEVVSMFESWFHPDGDEAQLINRSHIFALIHVYRLAMVENAQLRAAEGMLLKATQDKLRETLIVNARLEGAVEELKTALVTKTREETEGFGLKLRTYQQALEDLRKQVSVGFEMAFSKTREAAEPEIIVLDGTEEEILIEDAGA